MRRTRRTTKRISSPEVNDSDSDHEPLKKKKTSLPDVTSQPNKSNDEDSSSDSDIERYLKPANQIDLSSPFFTVKAPNSAGFHAIEKDIFSGIQQLTDSESESEREEAGNKEGSEPAAQETKINRFENLHTYSKKLEDAKKLVEAYKAKKKASEQNSLDVGSLLAQGEARDAEVDGDDKYTSLQSSDFESLSESEKEDWEEVQEAKEKAVVPQDGVEIRLEMPDTVRKKKGLDLMAALKRRLNRIKKENQVYVHKVHLLCWIAHGNHVNQVLNSNTLLALSLSLLPSHHCYPPSHLDLTYLEQILTWYRKSVSMQIVAKIPDIMQSLEDALHTQISNKKACDSTCFIYIFICILRSLGVRARLVLSVQVEPLRPPMSELCSLSNAAKPKNNTNKIAIKTPKVNRKRSEIKLDAKKNLNSSKRIDKKSAQDDSLVNANTLDKNIVKTPKISRRKRKVKVDAKNLSISKSVCKTLAQDDDYMELKANKAKAVKGSKHFALVKGKSKCGTDHQSSAMTTECLESFRMKNEPPDSKIVQKKFKAVGRSSRLSLKSPNELDPQLQHDSDKDVLFKVKHDRHRSRKLDVSKEHCDNLSSDTNEICVKRELPSSEPDQEDLKSLRRSARLSSRSPNELDPKMQEESDDEVFIAAKNRSRKPNLLKEKVNFKKMKNSNAPERDDFGGERHATSKGTTEVQIPQLDGANDTDGDSKPRRPKANLAKLKAKQSKCDCTTKKHSNILKSLSASDHEGTTRNTLNPETSSQSTANLTKLKIEQLKSKIKKQTRSTSNHKEVTGMKRNSPEDAEKLGSAKKLSLKKLRSPLDIKLANLRDIARSSQSSSTSSDGTSSRFFGAGSPSKKQLDVRNDIVNLVKEGVMQQRKRGSKNRNGDEDDSDYLPVGIRKKQNEKDDFKQKRVAKVKRRVPMKKDIAELERNEKLKKEEEKRKKDVNVWVEVFMEAEEKWICVDVVKGKLHCVNELHTRATQPVSYILAWDNDNYIKDVTKRYCVNWNTVTRKLRVNPSWWEATLKSFQGPKTARDREEDDELARQQLEKPLPTTISEYKDHPLYVLKRHLLKFQAIYPPDAVTLGFIRNEPVYSRDCVYVLHSRELWLKEAKVVKAGEQPYKIVKARPKYDKLSNTVITDKPLEIFGIWQVEDYVPPSAENGVVPRNAYGNVELFKPCMLPKGTVHLQLPGLNKVARKQNVDCAPAVTGFDFHAGWNHAVFDGYIVCEEHADKLVAAWYLEQEEAEIRAQEKREKRVYDNWKKLIKGLLIRERLKARYDFGPPTTTSKAKKKGKS